MCEKEWRSHAGQVSCTRLWKTRWEEEELATKPKKWDIQEGIDVDRLTKGEQLADEEVPLSEQQQIRPRFLVRVINPYPPTREDTATERQTGPVHQTIAAIGFQPSDVSWLQILEPKRWKVLTNSALPYEHTDGHKSRGGLGVCLWLFQGCCL